MKEPARVTPRCPIRTTLELVGGKWRLLIIHEIEREKVVRFGELKRLIPDISEKMLTQELKNLVDSGLIIRRDHREVPPRVDYQLTKKGELVIPLIGHIRNFGLDYLKE